jgi:hypothetical protein
MRHVGKGWINTIIVCFLFLSFLACSDNINQEKIINKYDTLLEQKIIFSRFSKPEQLSDFFDIRKLSAGLYSLRIGTDSMPLSLNEDSLGVVEINNDIYMVIYNPTGYNNTGVVLFSSKGKKNTKYFTFGSIIECSVFNDGRHQVLKIQENESVFAFGNLPVIREHWILLDSVLSLPGKDVSILKKASTLQDTSNLHIETSLRCNNDTLVIAINGTIDNQSTTGTLQIYPNMKLPEKLISLKWNEMDVFKLTDIK